MNRLILSILVLMLAIYSQGTVAAAGQTELQLEYQGEYPKFGGIYWGGHGLEVIWQPKIDWDYGQFQNNITADTGILKATVVDKSNLAKEDQWLSLRRLHTLEMRMQSKPIGIGVRPMEDYYDVSLDVEKYLMNGNPIPVYVYGVRQDQEGKYEEYLHDTIHVKVNYDGEAKAWWEDWQRTRQDILNDENKELALEWVLIASAWLAGLVALWFMRFSVMSAVRWPISLLKRLKNRGVHILKESPEEQELKQKIREAVANDDFDKAAKYATLAAQLKKIKL